ncbi:hypothetical protein NP493_252g01033 [Ridgeia piscesae]|uniref:Uncharacterized protein n=1 Tax=Ridgeia piscesae TaxID=27915 RepID=A0AAD9NYF8_RIDPI|nr:hypothetical protein NP493_252g01033 [Ridgeia piscesae]
MRDASRLTVLVCIDAEPPPSPLANAVRERRPERQYKTMSVFFGGFEKPYFSWKSASDRSKAVRSSLTATQTAHLRVTAGDREVICLQNASIQL